MLEVEPDTEVKINNQKELTHESGDQIAVDLFVFEKSFDLRVEQVCIPAPMHGTPQQAFIGKNRLEFLSDRAREVCAPVQEHRGDLKRGPTAVRTMSD